MGVRSSVVRIGNSRGLRIPRALLEEAGIQDQVDLSVVRGSLVVRPVKHAREGWTEAFQAMAAAGDDALPDPETATDFDHAEWVWDESDPMAEPADS